MEKMTFDFEHLCFCRWCPAFNSTCHSLALDVKIEVLTIQRIFETWLMTWLFGNLIHEVNVGTSAIIWFFKIDSPHDFRILFRHMIFETWFIISHIHEQNQMSFHPPISAASPSFSQCLASRQWWRLRLQKQHKEDSCHCRRNLRVSCPPNLPTEEAPELELQLELTTRISWGLGYFGCSTSQGMGGKPKRKQALSRCHHAFFLLRPRDVKHILYIDK